MKRYLKCKSSRLRKQLGERNDCSVLATSIVCRTSYNDAYEICKAHGRKPKRGHDEQDILNGIRALGFDIEEVENLQQKNGSQYTAKTIGNKLKRGYYLCFTYDHVFAVVNGDVEDWTKNRKYRVYFACKVIRRRN